MYEEHPAYYGILPASVRYDEHLSYAEMVLYSEISALSNKYGYCTATNGYFAELYGRDRRTVSRWIHNLKKYNHVRIEFLKSLRKIYPLSDYRKNDKPRKVDRKHPLTKMSTPVEIIANKDKIDWKLSGLRKMYRH
jgi:hypothetical protein